MKRFQGRVIVPGTCSAEALVSRNGFNTLASYQMALMFGDLLGKDTEVKCGDQNNPDLYKKPMLGKALCLPQTFGSTTGGLVLYCACEMGFFEEVIFKEKDIEKFMELVNVNAFKVSTIKPFDLDELIHEEINKINSKMI